MKIFFQANRQKPRAVAAIGPLREEAARLGLEVAESPAEAGVLFVLGGDGTILRAVHEHPGLPVLGINLGGLGYLSGAPGGDGAKALAMLAEGRYRIAERTMLAVGGATALNDIVVRGTSGHAAALELKVDGRSALRCLADGLIVATPTGSTAYSLSAGGPVVLHDSADFVITPMFPHSLGIRPMIVRDDVRLTVTLRRRAPGETEKLGVYADGETLFLLGEDESFEIAKSPKGARLVELEGYDPWKVLSNKLGWSTGGGL